MRLYKIGQPLLFDYSKPIKLIFTIDFRKALQVFHTALSTIYCPNIIINYFKILLQNQITTCRWTNQNLLNKQQKINLEKKGIKKFSRQAHKQGSFQDALNSFIFEIF
jgi:hypothetical protein